MFTKESLLAITGDASWYEPLCNAMELYEINTDDRVAAWLAQAAHESSGFRRLSENLNYSAEGLRRVFPKYFTVAQAQTYAHKPEAIANRAYASRMGNGNEASGEGWFYRGRGPFQLTGRDNYYDFGGSIGVDLVIAPQLVSDHYSYGALSAAWFWKTRGCNELADAGDFFTISKRINGVGLNGKPNGYDDRLAWLERTREAIA